MQGQDKASKEERYRRAMNNIKYHSSENAKWKFFFALFALVCVTTFAVRKYFCDKADLLGGRSAIRHYLICNSVALSVVSAMLVVFVVMLIRMKGISRRDSMEKVMAVVGTAIIVGYTFVALLLMDRNITRDYKTSAVYKGSEYVLCTKESKNDRLYYVGFEDSNGSYVLRIPKSVYRELGGGQRTAGADYGIMPMVTDAGYDDVSHYASDVEIEYYRYSAIFENVRF